MKLRLGQPVRSTDGHFGELADIIVDPDAAKVTHVVIQPDRNHFQARLVPLWLITEEGGQLTVQLDALHLRRLERVADADYVKFGEDLDLGPEWDIGTEDVSIMPYHSVELGMGLFDGDVAVSYDRIPKGECEIRRTSDVISGDGERVGSVDGFLADGDGVNAIVVSVGLPGFRHDVLVPFGSVARVRNDLIDLTITKDQFHKLPRTDVLGKADNVTAHISDLQAKVVTVGTKLANQGKTLVKEIDRRIRPDGGED